MWVVFCSVSSSSFRSLRNRPWLKCGKWETYSTKQPPSPTSPHRGLIKRLPDYPSKKMQRISFTNLNRQRDIDVQLVFCIYVSESFEEAAGWTQSPPSPPTLIITDIIAGHYPEPMIDDPSPVPLDVPMIFDSSQIICTVVWMEINQAKAALLVLPPKNSRPVSAWSVSPKMEPWRWAVVYETRILEADL